jgi:hypothetical protein
MYPFGTTNTPSRTCDKSKMPYLSFVTIHTANLNVTLEFAPSASGYLLLRTSNAPSEQTGTRRALPPRNKDLHVWGSTRDPTTAQRSSVGLITCRLTKEGCLTTVQDFGQCSCMIVAYVPFWYYQQTSAFSAPRYLIPEIRQGKSR